MNIGIVLIMLLSTIGPAAIIAVIGYSAVKSVARNPTASPKIFLVMILAFIFVDSAI